jgi:hypothetical protein
MTLFQYCVPDVARVETLMRQRRCVQDFNSLDEMTPSCCTHVHTSPCNMASSILEGRCIKIRH